MSSIWDAISGFFSGVWNDIASFARSIYGALKLVWDTLVSVFEGVFRSWHIFFWAAEAVARVILGTAEGLYDIGVWLVRVALPDVLRWALRELRALEAVIRQRIDDVLNWAWAAVAKLVQGLADVYKWIDTNVFKPLWAALTVAEHWIATTGATVEDWITNPEHLALLLLAPLWKALLYFLHGSERVIGHWLAGAMYTALVDTADVAETIISDIL